MATEMPNPMGRTVKYKVAVRGENHVGKTSIVTQFMFGTFNINYEPSIGLDFHSKRISLDERTVRLQLWDIPISWKRYSFSLRGYIRDSSAVIIVFDVTNRQSFISVSGYIEDVKNHLGAGIIMVLVGNKVDKTEERCVTLEEAAAKAKELGAMYIEVSAKTGDNIKPLFTIIAWILTAGESHTSRREINDIKLRPSASIQLQISRTSKKTCDC